MPIWLIRWMFFRWKVHYHISVYWRKRWNQFWCRSIGWSFTEKSWRMVVC